MSISTISHPPPLGDPEQSDLVSALSFWDISQQDGPIIRCGPDRMTGDGAVTKHFNKERGERQEDGGGKKERADISG